MSDIDIEKLGKLQVDIIEYIKKAYYENTNIIGNEEQTKNWVILPFLESLGYNTHSSDVIPEVTADFSKKGEKVDYELQVNNKPVALIECKKFMEPLSDHINQLYRYFPTLGVHIGILTNGIEYWFFTDSTKENVMDKKPYFIFDMSQADSFDSLSNYAKNNILNAPVPSIENKRKTELEERQQLEKKRETELEFYKTRTFDLQSQISNMQSMIEQSKANEELVKQMQSVVESLKYELNKAEMNMLALEMENDTLRENTNNNTVDKEAYNAMIINQKIQSDAIRQENEKLKKELKEAKKKPKQKQFYGGTDLDKQRVPDDIADDMIALYPDDEFVPEKIFFDPFCRYGELLSAIRRRLMQAPKMIEAFPDDDDRWDYISDNMLYAWVIDEKGLRDVTRVIHNTSNPKESHVVCFGTEEVYKKALLSDSKRVFITEKLKELGHMKFDVVIGNPPYNNDMYIPFVELGKDLAQDCSVFITPAKWQAKGGVKNEQFRKNIVPYMSNIVYYPDCTDVFAIGDPGGISYYLMDKNTHSKKSITNISLKHRRLNNKSYIYNDNEVRDLESSLSNIGTKIATKVMKDNKALDVERLRKTGKYQVWSANKVSLVSNIPKTCLWSEDGMFNCLGLMQIADSKTKDVVFETAGLHKSNGVPTDSRLIMAADNIDKCKSFISYCYTRFVRYMLSLSLCGLTGIATNNEWWRFVPDPGSFDHIFTDQELYKKYNLTDEEINIIESVIKERK